MLTEVQESIHPSSVVPGGLLQRTPNTRVAINYHRVVVSGHWCEPFRLFYG